MEHILSTPSRLPRAPCRNHVLETRFCTPTKRVASAFAVASGGRYDPTDSCHGSCPGGCVNCTCLHFLPKCTAFGRAILHTSDSYAFLHTLAEADAMKETSLAIHSPWNSRCLFLECFFTPMHCFEAARLFIGSRGMVYNDCDRVLCAAPTPQPPKVIPPTIHELLWSVRSPRALATQHSALPKNQESWNVMATRFHHEFMVSFARVAL